jgi:hypothetical protein
MELCTVHDNLSTLFTVIMVDLWDCVEAQRPRLRRGHWLETLPLQ